MAGSKKTYLAGGFSVHGSLNVPIEHHPTIRYMVYNGYYKVMSNIPKMGQLPTPAVLHLFPVFHGHTLGVYNGIHHLQTNTRVKLQIS